MNRLQTFSFKGFLKNYKKDKYKNTSFMMTYCLLFYLNTWNHYYSHKNQTVNSTNK